MKKYEVNNPWDPTTQGLFYLLLFIINERSKANAHNNQL